MSDETPTKLIVSARVAKAFDAIATYTDSPHNDCYQDALSCYLWLVRQYATGNSIGFIAGDLIHELTPTDSPLAKTRGNEKLLRELEPRQEPFSRRLLEGAKRARGWFSL